MTKQSINKNRTERLIFSALAVLLMTGIVIPDIIYVDLSAVGDNDGSDWLNAFVSLQDAVSHAGRGDSIHVAQGYHYPDRGNGISLGDRTSAFTVKPGIVLLGGFPYGGADMNKRNYKLYPTILSGDLKQNDPAYSNPDIIQVNDPNRLDNSYHVLITDNADPNTIIDGFEIVSGNCSGFFPDDNSIGAGIINRGGAPIVKNCIFRYNTAQYGGAVYSMSRYKDTSSAEFRFCTFSDNFSTRDGGAVHNILCSPEFLYCVFENNRTTNDGSGGAIYNNNSQATINACGFFGNHASVWGGAVDNNSGSSQVLNSVFSNNNAKFGGAVDNVNCILNRIINCTFYSNIAQTGAAVRNEECTAEIYNCIFWENYASDQGDSIALQLASHAEIAYCNIQNLQEGLFKDQESTFNFDTMSNSDYDPQFVLPAGIDRIPGTSDDDLHIKNISRNIDAGNNLVLDYPGSDIDLQNRFIDDPTTDDTGNGTGAIADIGADEYTTISDLNSDGLTDLTDLIDFASQWLTINCIHISECKFADINRDMQVEFNDLAIFSENWMPDQ